METNELLARIDERTTRILEHLDRLNNRLGIVEAIEQACPVRSIDVPQRLRLLEDANERQEGMATMVKIVTGGSVIAFITALISIGKALGIF